MKTFVRKFFISVSLVAVSVSAQAVTYYNCTTQSGCTEVTKRTWGWNTSYAKTTYPVVLQHGMWGSTENTIPSFYGVQEDLAKHGAKIFLTETHGFNSSYTRGEALLQQLEIIQALDSEQHGKFNLVGHSHGGFDIRYVAELRPDLVASATAVGSPARGTPVAELVQKIINGLTPEDGSNSVLVDAVVSVVNFLGVISDKTNEDDGLEQDALKGLHALTYEGAGEFNKAFPVAMETECDSHTDQADYENGVAYYSWSGTSPFTNMMDPLDYGIGILGAAIFSGEPNDGLVGRCSSHVGYVLRDNYRMNHLDELNQIFGMVSWFEANPKTVHRTHINRLKKRGL